MELKLKLSFTINGPMDTHELIMGILNRKAGILEVLPPFNPEKEHFFAIALNSPRKVINLELVSLGSNSQTVANPVEVFGLPVYKRASGIILAHNHPSGSPVPSEADKDMTNLLIQAGRLLKIPVLDHVIVVNYSYHSFKDSGLLEFLEASMKYVPPYELERQFHEEMQKEIKRLEKQHKIKLQESLQKGLQQGIQIGKKEGIEVGKMEGIGEGIQKGKSARNIEIAKNMRAAGYKADEIARMTGLPTSDIGSL